MTQMEFMQSSGGNPNPAHGEKLKEVYEKQLKLDELQEKDRIISQKTEEILALELELDIMKTQKEKEQLLIDQNNISMHSASAQYTNNHSHEHHHRSLHKRRASSTSQDTIQQQQKLQQIVEDLQMNLNAKDQIIEMYRQRDEATENTLNFQIEQEQKYQDLVKQYHSLESDWKNLEAYVKSLHEFQRHVESKYGMLLEEYQQLIAELPEEDLGKAFQEKEENLMEIVKAKDEEIHLLKEDKVKKEHVINALRSKEA